jgi:phospholipid/cholesterol/gamma-HCH transport system substrate-binding protein
MTRPLVKLLAFAVVTIVLTVTLGQTLGSLPFGGTAYKALFTDVTGLVVGDDVRISGVRVGEVRRIEVLPGAIAEVEFSVDDNIPLAASVRVKLRYRNLVGQRYLALYEGPGSGQVLRPGGSIPPSQTTPALDLTVLFNGFRPLFVALTPAEVNRLSYQIIQVLQGEGGTVASLLRRTASLTNTLADRDAVIGRVITNLNAVLSTLDERDERLDETIVELQRFVSGLAGDRAAIGDALANLGDLTSAAGALLHDARPAITADIAALGPLAGTLNDNAAVLDRTLTGLPDRFSALTRVASYGSWFNFYLCDFDGRVTIPASSGAGPSVNPATFNATAARCAA